MTSGSDEYQAALDQYNRFLDEYETLLRVRVAREDPPTLRLLRLGKWVFINQCCPLDGWVSLVQRLVLEYTWTCEPDMDTWEVTYDCGLGQLLLDQRDAEPVGGGAGPGPAE